MTKNYFNAKKVIMSTIAAVVFSFVFSTSANAATPEDEGNSIEINQPSNDDEQEDMQDLPDIISYILEIFGVRV